MNDYALKDIAVSSIDFQIILEFIIYFNSL